MKPAIGVVTLGLLCATLAHAQTEIILDNGTSAFSATGTWPASTSVTGFIGANYQTHEANGPLPGAVVVDNGGAGFSATGTWAGSTAVSGFVGTNYQVHAPNGEPPTGIVADNTSGTAVGTWPASTTVSGFYGTNYQPHAAGTGTDSFTWTLNVAAAGTYNVYARWTAHPNRATNAKYTVTRSGGQDVVTVNQQANTGAWQLLGSYSFDAGSASISLSDDANGYVIADAVMLAPPGAAPNTAIWTLDVPAAGPYNVYARWTQHPNRATNAPFTVNHAAGSTSLSVNQENGGGTWFLLGAFDFNAGSTTVTLTDQANGYVIADAVMLAPPGAAPNTATWTPNVSQAGTYQVYARWTASTNRATNATYTVTDSAGSTPIAVNQQANGGAWNFLGTFQLSPGTTHKIALTDQADGFVIADAIRLVAVSLQPQHTLSFIEVDHLNTPRAVYDASQQLLWQWDQAEPFGVNAPNEDPSSLGAYELPVRYPGQYADKETNLSYNYYRRYDPGIGRYNESDPAGLNAGLNTYAYVAGNPMTRWDIFGLEVGDMSSFQQSIPDFQASKTRCPPDKCHKNCLSKILGPSIDGTEVIVDAPMVNRYLGDGARGSVTGKNTVYTSLSCNDFWSNDLHVLHEMNHVGNQWGQGMTEFSYLWNWRRREQESDDFAQSNVEAYRRCLKDCACKR